MSERLDPEEVKEITSRVFGEISKIVGKYDGFIEKYVGDAVMALFGVPRAHEDDPLRAVRVAREIKDKVEAMSPELEERIGRPLSMHTGINTGLVVTGEVDMERGTHGVTGDTINIASRLSGFAKPGEILVSRDIYRQAESYFYFEKQVPKKIKGKAEPVQVYKVLSAKDRPLTIHRISGLRADLIGRKVEMDQLGEGFQQLREGKGAICSICGDAGTGKSRLVEEYKATLNPKEIQWLEGHAYPYSQNIPYFPLIDLMNRSFQIKEGDHPDKVRKKVESGIENLIGKKGDIVPYVGSLYALSYPEIEEVSPEFWKSRLQAAIHEILLALTQRRPTVICFEDLHWADLSSIELIHFLLSKFKYMALFLCVYRPPFNLFTSHQVSGMGEMYREIRLLDLSSSEARDLVESLLKTKTIPAELRHFIQEKVEGNPFYLEEVINSLIETETLVRDNVGWRLTRAMVEPDIPLTIQGIISGRIDRLEKETKRVLQEASVIGKTFLYMILEKTTDLIEHLDRCLTRLEQLDLVRKRSLQPDLEYIFKHALTQEVVYNGLLKKERHVLHEKIALVIEQLFHDRLSEFYETLAFHFVRGQSLYKAVDYLMNSGEKGLGRYAIEESNHYYHQAFSLLTHKPEKSREEEGRLIDLLIKWAYVFYYRGDFNGLIKLFSDHEDLAVSLDDKARLGMFDAWFGFALYMSGGGDVSQRYLRKALELGEETENKQVIAYACTWLAWCSWDLGLLDEVILFGERANEIARSIESDHYLYFKPLAGIGSSCLTTGDIKKCVAAGTAILDYGQKHSNIRSMAMGHICVGISHLLGGDFPPAIKSFLRAIQISADPVYSQYARFLLGAAYLSHEQLTEAEYVLEEAATYCQKFGYGALGLYANAYLGVVYFLKGQISRGLEMLEEAISESLEKGRKSVYAQLEHTLGKVYLELAKRTEPISFSLMAKDIGFLLQNVASASKNAENHLNKAIEVSKGIGARGVLGQAYLDLGRLHKATGRKARASECFNEAIQLFEQCEAEIYLKQAKAALSALK
jgi:class 3 adenylate cyclase/tetratricopeptide (TPR) repeat protein